MLFFFFFFFANNNEEHKFILKRRSKFDFCKKAQHIRYLIQTQTQTPTYLLTHRRGKEKEIERE